MPKMKTNRGAAKRFSSTGTGKFKRNKSGRRHILTSKDPAKKRDMRKTAIVSSADQGAVKKMLPYG